MSGPKPRLGKGLSGLLARPVAVSPNVVGTSVGETSNTVAGGARRAEEGEHGLPRTGIGGPGEGLQRLAVGVIGPSAYQPRTVMADAGLESLAASIKQSGVMQPIAVRKRKAEVASRQSGVGAEGASAERVPPQVGGTGVEYEIVAGERRWRAAMLAGLSEIPALVVELDDRGAAEWAIVENVQREDLNPMDRASAFERLIAEFGVTQAEVAERVGVERSTVANALRLLDLEPEVAELVAFGLLSAGHAKALLTGPRGEGRVGAARKAADEGWSVRAVEAWAERARRHAEGRTDSLRESVAPDPRAARVAHVAALEKQLGEHLGTKVRVRTDSVGKKGRVVIEFYSIEHFEGLMQRMGFRMES